VALVIGAATVLALSLTTTQQAQAQTSPGREKALEQLQNAAQRNGGETGKAQTIVTAEPGERGSVASGHGLCGRSCGE
jgi:hypothetical protein